MWATHKLGRWLTNERKVEDGEKVLLRNVYVPFLLSLQQREARAEKGGGDIIPLFGPRRK